MIQGFQSSAFQSSAFQMELAVAGGVPGERSAPAKGGRVKKVLARNEALDEARRRGTLRKVGLEDGGDRQGFADLEDFFHQEDKARKKPTAKQEAAAEAQLAAILEATPGIDEFVRQLQVEGASAADLVENIIQNDAKIRELMRLRADAEDEEDVIELLLLEH